MGKSIKFLKILVYSVVAAIFVSAAVGLGLYVTTGFAIWLMTTIVAIIIITQEPDWDQ